MKRNRIKYDATVETIKGIFHTRNVYDEKTGLAHIDIYDEAGNFIDEFASDFKLSADDNDPLEYQANEVSVINYIEENILL